MTQTNKRVIPSLAAKRVVQERETKSQSYTHASSMCPAWFDKNKVFLQTLILTSQFKGACENHKLNRLGQRFRGKLCSWTKHYVQLNTISHFYTRQITFYFPLAWSHGKAKPSNKLKTSGVF